MFYQEEIIDGVLSYRTSPTAEWTPFSAIVLTAKLDTLQRQLNHSQVQKIDLLRALKECVSDLFYQIEARHSPEIARKYPSIVQAEEAIKKAEQ